MTSPIEEELDEFATTYRREIVFNLRQLIDRGERVSVVFDEGRETFLTVLLAVDEEDGVLVFDWGGSEESNRRFLKSERNFFVCAPQGVHNQFLTGPARQVTHKGRRAFAVALPKKYTRLQRRQTFRLVLPITQRPVCRLPAPAGGNPPTFPVVDIGLGGIGMDIPTPTGDYLPGRVLAGATIDLKNFGVLKADLEIRFVGTIQRGEKQVGHLGCRFVDLSPAQEHQLQKFITHVQREERAHLAG
ncbi:MAG TPA: flagellar brake protein [Rhodocyclaceae bacterium]|nr:flagellar brake protein [Rhodocyclaceae bacterium]